ncbi:SDR family NAD(P)-dependent oxidoreductase [Marinobacter sp. S6332]|uniref:SDR family NAD(P)-dependent oxidoreductase n=1 Tax=Marinobacter sp. S6332 TaxID=2926403 RepID=UPI001FF56390|nr:SDR family NAD(P)-dependent oxidoreductase [Marinobacter sp. S6332]MCK0162413.1 SDR family NAD(P)-dependent oxidoreductase [Marinobacter sp. S6332]
MTIYNHVIITGGGSGLGLGIASRYLQRGCRVSVLDITLSNESRGQLDVSAGVGQTSWQFHVSDLTDYGRTQTSIMAAIDTYGAPDLAINSAGVVINKAFSDMQPSEFRRVVDINLNGSCHFAKAVLPTMKPGSRLALVASIAGLTSNYAYAAYGASKFGVVGLATTLRYEYEPQGIHISCICPPEVTTPMVEKERTDANPVSLELKALAGSLEPDSACDQIVTGLDAGRWQIIPGFSGKLTAFAARYLPGPFNAIMLKLIARALRKHSSRP